MAGMACPRRPASLLAPSQEQVPRLSGAGTRLPPWWEVATWAAFCKPLWPPALSSLHSSDFSTQFSHLPDSGWYSAFLHSHFSIDFPSPASFQCCFLLLCNKSPTTGWLKTTHMYYPGVLVGKQWGVASLVALALSLS